MLSSISFGNNIVLELYYRQLSARDKIIDTYDNYLLGSSLMVWGSSGRTAVQGNEKNLWGGLCEEAQQQLL